MSVQMGVFIMCILNVKVVSVCVGVKMCGVCRCV